MSGPFTNTVEQLVEQVNWLQTDKGMTWDNFRFGFWQDYPGPGGELHIPFTPAFPRELLGFSGTLDFSGGVRAWTIGFKSVTNIGFTAIAGLAGAAGGFVDSSQVVGIYFIAWGR